MPTPPTPSAAYHSAAASLREQLTEAQRRGPLHMPGPAQVLKVLDLADKAVADANQGKP